MPIGKFGEYRINFYIYCDIVKYSVMKKVFIVYFLLQSVYLFFMPFFSEAQDDKKKKILILHSYHIGYPWSDGIQKGLSEQLNKVSNLDIYTEYMDLIRNKNEESYLEKLESLFIKKYTSKNFKFDVIISVDDDAFFFLLSRRDRFFKDTPIVFCGVNDFKKDYLQGYKNITGINETKSIKETVQLAISLGKNASKLGVIGGSRLAEERNLNAFREAISKMKINLKIVYLTGLEFEDLISELKAFGPNDLLLYLSYLQTPSGKHFESDEIIKIISEKTDAKIFAVNDHLIKFNVIGGKVVYSFLQGSYAAKMAIEILNGKKADQIPIMMNSPNKYIFNAEALQLHSIPKNALPKDSLIINFTTEELAKRWKETVVESFFGYDLFKNHGTVMLIIDPKTGMIMDANEHAKAFYGYPKLIGKKIQEINTLTEEEVKQEMQKAKEYKKNFFKFRHRLADGSIRDVEVYSYPITLRNTPLLFSIIFDVTEKLATERKIKETEKTIIITLSLIVVLSILSIALLIFYLVKKSDYEKTLLDKNRKLEEANSKIKTLSGIIPICMHCKQIRDDRGYWNQLEKFITEHSDALFSHSICPNCMEKFYKDYLGNEKNKT
ncbi:MAG: PAS domain S-box protein [Thermodesulfovibrionales bacterium]|nr:PAS domain S-box protein [Thermodesulfovibrionales bacterium]